MVFAVDDALLEDCRKHGLVGEPTGNTWQMAGITVGGPVPGLAWAGAGGGLCILCPPLKLLLLACVQCKPSRVRLFESIRLRRLVDGH